MKEFEDSLRRIPAPELDVDRFKRTLRSELLDACRKQTVRRWRLATLSLTGVAVLLAAVLGAFVARPELPRELHAKLAGGGPSGLANADTLLAGSDATVEDDLEFIENLYAQRATPIEVRSMNDERVVLLAVREFTLSDGKQMVVYTEVGGAEDTPRPATFVSNPSTF